MIIGLGIEQFDALAPFGIVCSPELVVRHAGPSLRKALGSDLRGTPLLDAFAVERPRDAGDPQSVLQRLSSPFLLRAHDCELTLRCQAFRPEGEEAIVFFGTLALSTEADVSRLGLGYRDFAASDPTPDVLILKRTQERSLRDLAELNRELSRTADRLRQANSALADAEQRYRTLVESQPLVTYIDGLDDELTTHFVSSNVLELSGYSAEHWTGRPGFFFSIVHPADIEEVRREHLAAAAEGTPYKGEFRLMRADGAVVWVQASDRLVTGEGGAGLYRLGYMLDVTEQRNAEERLRETGGRLARLVESLQAGVLLEDEHRRVVLTNDAFCEIFGIPATPEQLVGGDCAAAAEESKALARDPELFAERIAEILRAGGEVAGEEVEFADGRVFERDYVPLRIGSENRGHMWSYRDVTSRIEAQREIERAHDEAVAASRAKSEFLATVSHEIRTPMHGVLGTIDLLGDTSLDAEQRELVEIVRSSAGSLLAVINDMLDLQKAESGQMELQRVPVDLEALVWEVLATLRPAAKGKGLALVSRVQADLPPVLLGDPHRLRQILMNLAGNAVKFTDSGSITVTVSCALRPAGGAEVTLAVADTGVGISPEDQARVFEPFSQSDSSASRRHEGTGLGLAITRRLAELMGGEVQLESAPGHGTTVTARVRLQSAGAGAEPVSDRELPADRARPPLAGRVLVAEDSAVNRDLALRQLARLGLQATAVGSGAEVLQKLRTDQFDIVLMDVRMAGMDGLATTRAIRARESELGLPRLPIVAVTANAMPEDRAACAAAGMDGFAGKPLVLGQLADALAPWLAAGEPGAAGEQQQPAQGTEREDDVAAQLQALAGELGSQSAAARIADAWLAELPERLRAAALASARGDSDRLAEAAHALKSACALIGAHEAARLAARIEAECRQGTPDAALVQELVTAAERAEGRVRAWRGSCAPTALPA